jgi:hypothetical protein
MKFISELKITHASYICPAVMEQDAWQVCVCTTNVRWRHTTHMHIYCVYCIVYNDLQSHPIYKELHCWLAFFCLLNVFASVRAVRCEMSCYAQAVGASVGEARFSRSAGRCATPPNVVSRACCLVLDVVTSAQRWPAPHVPKLVHVVRTAGRVASDHI